MNIEQSFILGIVQGITEFLPISSDGHLVLGELVLGLKTEAFKSFDVIAHMGTLLAIFIYFRKDVWELINAFLGFFKGNFQGPYAKLVLYIVVGTIPAVIAGVFFGDWMDETFRNVKAVGTFMIISGIIYLLAEIFYKNYSGAGAEKGFTLRKSVVIGLAQMFALLPGVSRSGSTITAGISQGISRSEAARFSFLLGVPAILGAGIFTFIKSHTEFGTVIPYQSLAVGFFTSFIFGLFSISFLMRFLKKYSLNVFAIYMIIIGGLSILN